MMRVTLKAMYHRPEAGLPGAYTCNSKETGTCSTAKALHILNRACTVRNLVHNHEVLMCCHNLQSECCCRTTCAANTSCSSLQIMCITLHFNLSPPFFYLCLHDDVNMLAGHC